MELKAADLARRTSDAYAFGLYNSWEACVRALRREGLGDGEIEAVLRSKWARWAADRKAPGRKKASSMDLVRYLRENGSESSIRALVDETFGR